MRRSTALLLVLLVSAPTLADEPDAGWVDLFDGKSLDGWRAEGKEGVSIEEGEIRLLSKGKNLWLPHERSWTDFELEVEALMPAEGYNSGIGFRCTSTGRFTGYQCEIENAKSGSIYAIGKGWIWPKGKEQTATFDGMAKNAFRVGEWNRFRIRCEGNRVRIWVNDTLTADVTDDTFT